MLVTMESNPELQCRAPSIMESLTLARVERARNRYESQPLDNNENQSLERRIIDSKPNTKMIGRPPIEIMSSGPIKRGLLWQQRDRIFSRWKERYFVLTRDYLHCFKRATGSANERISDMGQFIFKIKLVDVERVEWLNRRSYSAISLFLGREGRVLLRTENGLEDWYELLEECTLISKERRHALRITQGPRSRASLAALPCHSSLQTTHMSLGGTYSSAVEDWLTARQKTTKSTHNQFQLCDSVPDLSTSDADFIIQSTKHAIPTSLTPRKIPSNRNGALHANNIMNNNNFLTNGYEVSQRIQNVNGSSLTKPNNNNYKKISGSMINTMSTITPPSTTKITSTTKSKTSATNNITNIEYDNDNNEVQLRRNAINRNDSYENKTNDKQNDWMYRRPTAPNDIRHSLLTDIDISACDSGLDTPQSTHRPSSYREPFYMMRSARDSIDTGVSSLAAYGISPKDSIHRSINDNGNMAGSRRSIAQDSIQYTRNEKSRYTNQSSNKLASIERHDPNRNKCHKLNDMISTDRNNLNGNLNSTNSNSDGNVMGSASVVMRERYQHPALITIMNEMQGMNFRERSYSDNQQKARLLQQQQHHLKNSPSPRRRPTYITTPTRI